MKDYLISKLALVYRMHEYDLKPEKMKYIIICLNKKQNIEKLTKELIDLFISNIEIGSYGILYKQPTCIAYMFSRFIEENMSKLTQIGKRNQSYDDILKKDWQLGK